MIPNFGAVRRAFDIAKWFIRSTGNNYKALALLTEMLSLPFSVYLGDNKQCKINDYFNKDLETAEIPFDKIFTYQRDFSDIFFS